MAAYNAVNGSTMTEHKPAAASASCTTEWGFDGAGRVGLDGRP